MAEWLLVRHGETQWNAEQRVQGQSDIPLREQGRRQIERVAARLAARRFEAVYASDLSRVRETAGIIIAANEFSPVSLRIDPSLREIAFGEFEGMTWSEIAQSQAAPNIPRPARNLNRRQPTANSPRPAQLLDRQLPAIAGAAQDLDYRPPGGESYRDLLDRCGPFAESLLRGHPTDNVLIVGHGAALRALAVRLLDLPYDAYWTLGPLASGSISAIRLRRGRAALAAWNDTGHLE